MSAPSKWDTRPAVFRGPTTHNHGTLALTFTPPEISCGSVLLLPSSGTSISIGDKMPPAIPNTLAQEIGDKIDSLLARLDAQDAKIAALEKSVYGA